MTGRVNGKLALVTGAARGLGRAIAEALANEGAAVVVTDVNGKGASMTANEINARHTAGTAFAIQHDVTNEGDWQAAIDCAREKLGGLSILVNNAGILQLGSVEELSLEDWRRSMAVNADSVFLGCKAALPLMRDHQPGSIVNLSSISAMIAAGNTASYNASKAAVWMLTKSVALHCARRGWDIRCNSLHPTFIQTPMLDEFAVGRDHDVVMEKLTKQVPLGRLGSPEDVAMAVIYLGSDESRYMTAAELKLDGGISAM